MVVVRALLLVAVAVAIASGACTPSDRSGPPLPPPARPAARLVAGDTLQVTVVDDDALSDEVTLDRDGNVTLRVCGRIALAGVDAQAAAARIAHCFANADAYVGQPWVSVMLVRRTASVTLLVGPSRRPREVPADDGLRLVDVLSTELARPPSLVTVRRDSATYTIDVDAVLRGAHANEPLVAGDTIVVDEDLPLREPVARAGVRTTRAATRGGDLAAATCGELTLKGASYRATGRGEHHPDLVAIGEALRARCPGGADEASLREACDRARGEQRELVVQGYGPAHPSSRAVEAKLAACPAFTPRTTPPPTEAECAQLRSKHAALLAAGKGENHPDVRAAAAQIEMCR